MTDNFLEQFYENIVLPRYKDAVNFDDGLSREVVKCGDETSIELRFSDDARQVPNVTGWFTLYREK